MAKRLEGTDEARMIGVPSLKSLIVDVERCETRIASARGSMGEMIKHAEEKKNLDRWAFSIARRLLKMDERTRLARLNQLDYLRDVLKLDVKTQEEMEFEESENVVSIKGGKKSSKAKAKGGGGKKKKSDDKPAAAEPELPQEAAE